VPPDDAVGFSAAVARALLDEPLPGRDEGVQAKKYPLDGREKNAGCYYLFHGRGVPSALRKALGVARGVGGPVGDQLDPQDRRGGVPGAGEPRGQAGAAGMDP